MSFFIKSKPTKNSFKSKFANKKQQRGKAKKPKLDTHDDEITSSSEEEDEAERTNKADAPSSEDENETAQEKKLRLAKIYLEEIAREETSRFEDKEDAEEINGDVISKRLKLDYLKQVGRLKLRVADDYIGADSDNIKILKAKEHRSAITCLCISPDNKFVFSGSKDGSIVKWSLPDYKKVSSIPFCKKSKVDSKEVLGHSKAILCIAISYDSKFLVVGDASNIMHVWNPDDLKHKGSLKGHRDSVTGVSFRGETHTLYSSSNDRSVKVWTLDEMSYVETLYGHQDKITSIDALLKERAITSGGRDTSIRLWKIMEESQLIYNGHSGSIDIVRFINEEHFVSGGDDGFLCVWSISKKKALCIIKEAHGRDLSNSQPYWITSVGALVNTDLIASGSCDGLIRIWKLTNNYRQILPLFNIEITGFINDIVFTTDGRFLIAAIGSEHRFGRWSVIKSAKNGVALIPLQKKIVT